MMLHGANIYKYAQKIGCHPNEIIDFSSNINTHQPTPKLNISNEIITKYADTNYTKLKRSISKEYQIKPEEIALYNGATAAISALIKNINSNTIYLYAPLYGEYQKYALESGKKVYKINRLKDIDATIEKKSTVVFVNPSTPDGKYYDIEKLFRKWKKRQCTIILDESFLEFEQHQSLRKKIREYKKLYIIQSFSKFYSCAGVRIGAIFANKKSIKKLPLPLWNISSLDAKFLQKRLEDRKFKQKTLQIHKEQKKELKNILTKSKIFDTILESDANFILVHTPKALQLFNQLLAHKIVVRTCGSFDYLTNEWLRFAVKDKKSHQNLAKILAKFEEN